MLLESNGFIVVSKSQQASFSPEMPLLTMEKWEKTLGKMITLVTLTSLVTAGLCLPVLHIVCWAGPRWKTSSCAVDTDMLNQDQLFSPSIHYKYL